MERPRRQRRSLQVKTPQQLQEQNNFYSALFGEQALREQEDEEPKLIQRQLNRQKRKIQLKQNLQCFPYVRAYHYYFSIDQIPRLQGHPSYAQDNNNLFGWTFSHQNVTIGDIPLLRLLNRNFVGLPREVRENEEKTGEKQMKERLSEQILQREQKMYSIDRVIYTCEFILKNKQKLIENGKISQFKSIAKRQPQLQVLSLNDVSFSDKIDIVTRVVLDFKKKKEQLILKQQRTSQRRQQQCTVEKQDQLRSLGVPSKKIKQE